MSNAVQKIAELKNVIVEVNVSEIAQKNEFLGKVTLNAFDPKNFQPNGGPIATKVVQTSALGSTYDEAYENALQRAVSLFGL